MKGYPYAYYVALDGNGINGLEGMAGMCLFLFNPEDNSYAHKIKYYDGAAAGHWVSINPAQTVGFLGNAAQHLLFFDAATLEEVDRISTLRFEPNDTSLRGSTHLVWLNDNEFITAVGDYFYRFDLRDLSRGERLGPHNVKLPHGMKLSPSGNFLCYGSMDNPKYGRRGEAREVGIWDMRTQAVRRIQLPATCWHVEWHRDRDVFYAVTFRVLPQDHVDYHEWAMAYLKEYCFEIDAAEGQVLRHWACSRDTPAHINSDITISDKELIFCNGGSQSIICIDLESFRDFRIIDERPDLQTMLEHPREVTNQVFDAFARGGAFTSSRHFVGALRVSRLSLLDSIYGCQLSTDQSLLFTANRGLNHVTVYNYPDASIRFRVRLPDLQDYVPWLTPNADPRLGLHHSHLLSFAAPPEQAPGPARKRAPRTRRRGSAPKSR